MDKLKRTLWMFFPVLVFIISAVILLTTTAIKGRICWAFNIPNYWDLSNEWFQIVNEYEDWLRYWRTGRY